MACGGNLRLSFKKNISHEPYTDDIVMYIEQHPRLTRSVTLNAVGI
jgi:hypothetical protein